MKPVAFLISLMLLVPTLSEASNFSSVKLPRGIELKLPIGWLIFDPEHKRLVELSLEATNKLLGYGEEDKTRTNLVTASSSTKNTYANVKVDSYIPASEAPDYISRMSPYELNLLEKESSDELKRGLVVQGNQLLSFSGVRRGTVSGYPSLITEYRRSGPRGPVVVTVIHVITQSQEILISLSYREAEAAIWKPVMAVISQSITIRR